jgi:virginiamycin B lyase
MKSNYQYILYSAAGIAMTGLLALFYSGNYYYLAQPSGQEQLQPPASKSYDDDDYFLRGAINEESVGKQVAGETKKYICGTSFEKNTEYMGEYSIPLPCSQPVGIAVGRDDRIWIAATWPGYLLVFDPQLQAFQDFIEIPDWNTKGDFGSMVWGMDFDGNGDLWFTDQLNNAVWRYYVSDERFEIYKVPTPSSYPSQIAFDPEGNIWFSEIFGKKIGMIDPESAANNTTQGIIEYELPADLDFETMGPVTMSRDNRTLWFTAVTFPDGGHLVGFDINSKDFEVYSLPKQAGVPIGIAEDDKGRLWINDHATNLFFMFDPSTQQIVQYSTSLPTSRDNTTTLPYWNAFRNGKVWFNEHEGNAIAYFDIQNLTLIEYQIPTKGEVWGNTTNPLKFSLDNKGSAWFTEWTENKIGFLDAAKAGDLPLSVSVSKNRVVLDRTNVDGETVEVLVYPFKQSPQDDDIVKMTAASSISKSGRLWNVSGTFSEDAFYFTEVNNPHKVSFTVKPTSKDLVPGNYTLTVGARYGSVTFSKIIDLEVR